MNAQKSGKTDIIEAYRQQIRECARNLAVAKKDKVTPFLPSPDVAYMVDVFTEGNLDKRIWKLTDQFEFMKDEFDELDQWYQEYIHVVPLKAYDIGTTDSTEFLKWIRANKDLSREQLDCVTCHESRVEIEETARGKRMAHVRFQDILSRTDVLMDEFGTNPDLWIHLNPVRVWTTFMTTALLDEESNIPAQVIFFPNGSDIRTAVLEVEGAALVSELEAIGPCRLEQLLVVMGTEHDLDRDDIIDTCRALAEMGLIAFG